MATINQKDWLEKLLAKEIEETGPDSKSVKALKAQIASLGTVRHPSQLAALNSSKNDEYHGSVLAPASAQHDPMQPAMDGMEAEMLKQAEHYLNMAKAKKVP